MIHLQQLVTKRGTIHLCKIGILLLDRDFEHDIYELIKAFYPEGDIHSLYEKDEEAYDIFFTVKRENDNFVIKYATKDHKGVASAEVIRSADEASKENKGNASQEDQAALPENKAEAADGDHSYERYGKVMDAHELRKANKDSLKYALYNVLVKLTGRTLPWGNLTGIRPAKLAMGMIESGMKNTEVAQVMREHYLVSARKTALAITIANRERALLADIDYEHGYSLYVGIPFCPSICLYCSFSSYPLKIWAKRVDEYLDALCKEIRETARMMKNYKLDTIYIGGGTPTTLEPYQLKRLLDQLGESFGFDGLVEFTIEAGRPDSITREKLETIKKFPVTRISVNPQTMNQDTLEIIGRRHTVAQTIEAFHLARELDYNNINMDLIVGLPGEDISKVKYTLEKVKELSPDSLTVHSLAVKRAARLNMFKDKYQEMTFENNQEIMDLTQQTAYSMEMGPYYLYRQKNMKGNFENVGYAKVDKAGIYNILIMEEKQPIIALGAGGSSKLVFDHGKRIERVENVKDVTSYIARIDEMIERKRTGIETWL
ncbi:coproporphyrinogen dehydrogenase HemZ [Blautia sp.]